MNTNLVAIDPRTGRHLRAATARERAAYQMHNNNRGAFSTPVRVGAVLVDEYTGPGIWFGGAGF